MSSRELDEIRATAERRLMTVSAWVRLVLREERERAVRGRATAVREGGGSYGEAPAGPTPRVRLEVEGKEELRVASR